MTTDDWRARAAADACGVARLAVQVMSAPVAPTAAGAWPPSRELARMILVARNVIQAGAEIAPASLERAGFKPAQIAVAGGFAIDLARAMAALEAEEARAARDGTP